MKKYVSYTLTAIVFIGIQGCVLKSKSIQYDKINEYSLFMKSNQTFECKDDTGMQTIIIKKDDIFPITEFPEKTYIREGSGGVAILTSSMDYIPDNIIFLKIFDEHSSLGLPIGFPIYSNGIFPYDKVQLGTMYIEVNKGNTFRVEGECHFKGKTPFEPITLEKAKDLLQN
ncbi:hypothetical protein [Sulfurimonas sp.]|uniref:hypothetical protein n=1 Tax=Sulfurimonas sp. TaxID=2022749 RepID=UPI003D100B26